MFILAFIVIVLIIDDSNKTVEIVKKENKVERIRDIHRRNK